MNWFKKSIVYDQKRRLLALSILMMIGILYSIIDSISTCLDEDIIFSGVFNYTVALPSITYTSILFMMVIMTVISVGIRDKYETEYIISMPMKQYHVILTKLTCVIISVIIPITIGFVVNSIAFFINKSVLTSIGFLYKDIVYKYLSIIIICLIVICFIYLISLMYNNIKVPAVLCSLGAISVFVLFMILMECVHYSSPLRVVMDRFLNVIGEIIYLPTSPSSVYYPNTLGKIIILVGIAVLMFTLVEYVTSKFENDIYDNLFSFKISKVISYIVLILAMIAITAFLSCQLGSMLYLQPLSRSMGGEYDPDIYTNASLLVYRLSLGLGVILTPLWFIVSKKINKKLEERF